MSAAIDLGLGGSRVAGVLSPNARIRAAINRVGGGHWLYNLRSSRWRNDGCDLEPWFRKHRAFFVHIPKTAGTTISQHLGIDWLTYTHIPIARAMELHPEISPDWCLFASVRHPVSRFISTYDFYRRGSPIPVHRDLARLYFEPDVDSFALRMRRSASYRRLVTGNDFFFEQGFFLRDGHGTAIVERFIRLESLADDLKALGDDLQLDLPDALPHARRSTTGGAASSDERLSPEARRFVEELYASDMTLLGYERT